MLIAIAAIVCVVYDSIRKQRWVLRDGVSTSTPWRKGMIGWRNPIIAALEDAREYHDPQI